MKRILAAVLIASLLVTPAFAAKGHKAARTHKVYLKEGGVIEARKVWRSDGKVHVWAEKDSMTSFDASEINLKKTFPAKRRAAKKPAAAAQPAAAAPAAAAAGQKPVETKPAEKKPGVALPALPKLPEKSPEKLVPASGGGGTIKQHKKEMAEKTDQ